MGCVFESEEAILTCIKHRNFTSELLIDSPVETLSWPNHLRLKEPYPHLRKFSVFAYFQGPPLPPIPMLP